MHGEKEMEMSSGLMKEIAATALLASASLAWSQSATLAGAAPTGLPDQAASAAQQAPVATNVVPEKVNGPGLGRHGNGRLLPAVLVDANGELVGRFVENAALLEYQGEALAIPLAWDAIDAHTASGYFTWGGYGPVFTTPDCTGKPYGYPNYMIYGTRYVAQSVYDPNTKSWSAYVFDHDNMQLVTIGSRLQYDQWAKTTNCYASSGQMLYMPAIDTISLDAFWKPPLKVR
jgi:hypothetical protein